MKRQVRNDWQLYSSLLNHKFYITISYVILPMMLRNLIQAYVSLLQKSRKLKWNKTAYAKSFFNIFKDRNKYCRNQQIRLTSHSPIHVKPPWSPNTHEATLIFHFTWSHPDLPFHMKPPCSPISNKKSYHLHPSN